MPSVNIEASLVVAVARLDSKPISYLNMCSLTMSAPSFFSFSQAFVLMLSVGLPFSR